MSSSNLSLSDMQIAVRDTVRYHWQLFLTQGVIMTILGILAVIWPGISTIAVDVYVGWLFLFSGIVGLFTMFLAQDAQAFLWMLLTAALALFVGIMLLWHPTEGAVSLTAVLTAFFIVEGNDPPSEAERDRAGSAEGAGAQGERPNGRRSPAGDGKSEPHRAGDGRRSRPLQGGHRHATQPLPNLCAADQLPDGAARH